MEIQLVAAHAPVSLSSLRVLQVLAYIQTLLVYYWEKFMFRQGRGRLASVRQAKAVIFFA